MASVRWSVPPPEPWVGDGSKNDGRSRTYRPDCQTEYNEWRDMEILAEHLQPEKSSNYQSSRVGRRGPLAAHQKAKARFVKKFGGPCRKCKERKVSCPLDHFPPAYERIYQTFHGNTKHQATLPPSDSPLLVPAELGLGSSWTQGVGSQFGPHEIDPIPSFLDSNLFARSASPFNSLRPTDSLRQTGIYDSELEYSTQFRTSGLDADSYIDQFERSRALMEQWEWMPPGLPEVLVSCCADSGYGCSVPPLPPSYTLSLGDVGVDEDFTIALCRTILEAVGWTGDKRLWHSISQGWPHLVRTFALRLSACPSAQADPSAQAIRDIMRFIHRNHVEIAAHLAVSSVNQHDEEQSSDTCLDNTAKTVFEMRDYWRTKFRMLETPNDTNLFGEPPDLEGGVSNLGGSEQTLTNFGRHRDLIMSSDAFQWLVTTVRTFLASSYQAMNGLAITDISNKVLSILNTGRVNRHRETGICRMVFHIPWFVQDNGLSERIFSGRLPKDVLAELQTIVGSMKNPQELDCLTYARRVWPFGGEEIAFTFVEALQDSVEPATISREKRVTLGDRTELVIQKHSDHVIVDATGIASALSLCAEQLAWLGATFYCLHQTHRTICTPRIETRLASQIAGSDEGLGLYAGFGYFLFTTEPLTDQPDPHQFWQSPSNLSMVNGYPRLEPLPSPELIASHSLPSSAISGSGSSKPRDNSISPLGRSSPADSTTQFTSPNAPLSDETMASSSGMPSTEEWESDILSITEEISLPSPVTSNPLTLEILESVKVSLAEKFLDAYGCAPGTSGQWTSYNTTTPKSASADLGGPSETSRTTSNKRGRRCHGQNEGDDEGSGDEKEANEPKSKKRKPCPKATRFLACPFWKFDPKRHRRCLIRAELTLPRYVKQHLARKHAPDYFCDRCGTIYKDESSYDAHRESLCEKNPREVLVAAMSPARKNAVMRKSIHKSSEESSWYTIWDCLFPGYPRPASVYVSDSLLEYTTLLEAHCRENYPSALREQMVAARLFSPLEFEAGPGVLESYLDFTIRGVFDTVFQSWRNQESRAAYPDDQGSTYLPPAITMTALDGSSGLNVQGDASTGAPLALPTADIQDSISPHDLQLHREGSNVQYYGNPNTTAADIGQWFQF